jgi:hypothetical protein
VPSVVTATGKGQIIIAIAVPEAIFAIEPCNILFAVKIRWFGLSSVFGLQG